MHPIGLRMFSLCPPTTRSSPLEATYCALCQSRGMGCWHRNWHQRVVGMISRSQQSPFEYPYCQDLSQILWHKTRQLRFWGQIYNQTQAHIDTQMWTVWQKQHSMLSVHSSKPHSSNVPQYTGGDASLAIMWVQIWSPPSNLMNTQSTMYLEAYMCYSQQHGVWRSAHASIGSNLL